MKQLACIIAGLFFLGVCGFMQTLGEAPPRGWTTDCKIVGIVDGDTVDVEVKRVIRVRLLGAWSPESRTKDAAEKQRGIAAKEHLQAAAEGCDALLHIPGSVDISEWMTLGRVLGHVYLVNSDGTTGESLAEMQVRAGHATPTKEKKKEPQ